MSPFDPPAYVRAIAIAFVRRGREILVFEGHDSEKGETFYRPLGGGIEFGETGEQAVVREFIEEVGIEPTEVSYRETFEDLFTYEGKPGHEIVRVYETKLADDSWLRRDEWRGIEEDGTEFRVLWKSIDAFSASAPLYPPGLLDLLLADEG